MRIEPINRPVNLQCAALRTPHILYCSLISKHLILSHQEAKSHRTVGASSVVCVHSVGFDKSRRLCNSLSDRNGIVSVKRRGDKGRSELFS